MIRNIFGFSLLELIVTIGVLATVMMIGLPAYRAAESRQILKNAAQMLAMDLKAQRQRANQMNYPCGVEIKGSTYSYDKYDQANYPTSTTKSNIKTVEFKKLFGRDIGLSLNSCTCPTSPSDCNTYCSSYVCSTNSVGYLPLAGGGCLPTATIKLTLGSNSIDVRVAEGGEVIVDNIKFN